ncbi:sigma-70 family RNA polymerase sigma factor [Cohnella sp. AR92]|uniref:sigma-70 family RNA polymerase sigma factor n=1 Tax=Cohnella sp. AR92 TaxID=648716 RepID=UPI000F8E286B|nr:sigma-70 family RNA polymerase sigma factor [Cohnella sp. AR92]RUS46742.1 sigma-70 family RNA polymerase sigma factor [Cohnella sp. AR92]
MALTPVQRERFQRHCEENRLVYSDRVIRDFFLTDRHVVLLLRALDGEEEGRKELDDRFRKHFFRIRFVKYLVSTIKFCTIDQQRQHRKNDNRYPLIFDRPSSAEGDGGETLGERQLSKQIQSESEAILADPDQFKVSFSNESLSRAFAILSPKQQHIATLYYSLCYQDNEIARMIGVSPQAVSKTRNLALKKLRLALIERG